MILFSTFLQYLTPVRLKQFINKYILYSKTDPREEQAFQQYIQQNTVKMAYPIFSIIALVVVLFWPTDFMILSDSDVFWTYVIWRSSVVIGVMLLFVGLEFSMFLRRYINLTIIVITCLISSGIGFAFGRVSGLSDPWFWAVLIVPWVTLFLGLKLLQRFASTLLIILSFSSGFIAPFPEHLAYPRLSTVIILLIGMVFLISLAGHVLYHFMRKDYFQQRELEEKKKKLRKLARYDQLTGLLNRRSFENELEEEFERSQRYDNKLSVLMIDLDHFKEINDTYGHQAGDQVLEVVGELLHKHTRTSDSGGRYGGEEFCVFLPETDSNRAKKTAQRFRESLKDHEFGTEDGESFRVTCSIGVAERTDEMSNFTRLIKSADKALYDAKQQGRDRVIVNT